jgi:hypothetical protein
MSQELQPRMDNIVETEVVRGYRVKALDPEILELLQEYASQEPSVKVFDRVRFTKLTPRKRRLINQAVVEQYHRDLKATTLLSKEEIRKLNVARGQWSDEKEKRLQELEDKVTTMQRSLYYEGFNPQDEWLTQLLGTGDAYREALRAENANMTDEVRADNEQHFLRWLNYTEKSQPEYKQYAAEQGKDQYSEDWDFQWLMDHAPNLEAQEALAEADELRGKLQRYMECLEARKERDLLRDTELRMYAGSVESRQETVEELARIYFCTDVVDEAGKVIGNLTPRFEDMENLPDELIRWLQLEIMFFFNGTPDTAREYLVQWGFIPAPRPTGSPESPDESLAEPSSKPDTEPSVATPSVSSVSGTPTISVTSS